MGIKAVTYTPRPTGEPARNETERACFGFLAGNGARGLSHVGWMPNYGNSVPPTEREFWKAELIELVDTVPILSGFEVVNRDADFMNLEVKISTEYPADKIILGFFFLRNLTHYNAMRKSYVWLKGVDMTPACRLMMSNMFSRVAELSSLDSEDRRWTRTVSQNEPSPFHYATFGKISFLAFANQDENYKPWLQDPMNVSDGYRRDSNYTQAERVPTNLTNNLASIGATERHPRYMASAFTITELEAPLHEGMTSGWSGSDGTLVTLLAEILDENLGISDELKESIRWASLSDEERSSEVRDNPISANGLIRQAAQVKLTATAKAHYSNSEMNPHSSVGFVTAVQTDAGENTYIYSVRWESTGLVNSYRANDIEVG